MKITKGTHLHIDHARKGRFDAIAYEDFDADEEEFYPVAVAGSDFIAGMNPANYWIGGDKIPCRNSLCTIEIAD